MKRLIIFALGAVLLLPGCASWKYNSIPKGELGGRLTIEWIGADKFIYRPDAQRPFYFKRANGEVIKPRAIYTDGGSIPRPFWAVRGYSPWGYGPAYIAHDWLFSAHHCGYPEATNHTVFTAADVLSECMKTIMESNPDVVKSPALLVTVDEAVRSPIAQNLWNKGECQLPPPDAPASRLFMRPFSSAAPATSPRWIQSYDFDKPKR